MLVVAGTGRSLLAIVIITSDEHHERTFASGADSVVVGRASERRGAGRLVTSRRNRPTSDLPTREEDYRV
jgi:hypothetical protein